MTASGWTGSRNEIFNSGGQPYPSGTGEGDELDLQLFGPQNLLFTSNSLSLTGGRCSSTKAAARPFYNIELGDLFEIYKIVITFPNDEFGNLSCPCDSQCLWSVIQSSKG